MFEPSWVGRRVSIRRVTDRSADGALLWGDVVGDLLHLDSQTAVVETRTGPVEVAVALVGAAKLAPPSTADELALEAVAARGWLPEDTAQLGGWLLRAARGFTGRANSVLPLRPPGRPLDEALKRAGDWYAERGLPLRIQVPVEARRLLDAELAERGWHFSPMVHVMAARLDQLSVAGARAPTVTVQSTPDDTWLARYRDGVGLEEAARGVLTRHAVAAFASVRGDGRALAIGRGVVDDGWLGVSAVEVDPKMRRRGLATAVLQALWRWGERNGAVRSYVQVSSDNDAVQLYRRVGYWPHHDYHYRQRPTVQLSPP